MHMLSHKYINLQQRVLNTWELQWADTRGCPASRPPRAPRRTPGAWARGLGSTEEAEAHTHLLQPVLLPPALAWAVDKRPCGHFVVIQQTDNDHDHHRDHHNDDDDLGELQLRCGGRGNRVNHMPFAHHPLSSPGPISSRHSDHANHKHFEFSMNLVLTRTS